MLQIKYMHKGRLLTRTKKKGTTVIGVKEWDDDLPGPDQVPVYQTRLFSVRCFVVRGCLSL
jgi:hypothetical protein